MFFSHLIIILLSVLIVHFTNNYVFGDENLHENKTLLNRNSTFKPIVNGTKYKLTNSKRRSVLILNSDNALRSQKVTSLLYKDYDDKGNILNTHAMYDLRDVVTFFEVFLDTEICHEKCSREPNVQT